MPKSEGSWRVHVHKVGTESDYDFKNFHSLIMRKVWTCQELFDGNQ